MGVAIPFVRPRVKLPLLNYDDDDDDDDDKNNDYDDGNKLRTTTLKKKYCDVQSLFEIYF